MEEKHISFFSEERQNPDLAQSSGNCQRGFVFSPEQGRMVEGASRELRDEESNGLTTLLADEELNTPQLSSFAPLSEPDGLGNSGISQAEHMTASDVLDYIEYDFSSLSSAHLAFDAELESFSQVKEEYFTMQTLDQTLAEQGAGLLDHLQPDCAAALLFPYLDQPSVLHQTWTPPPDKQDILTFELNSADIDMQAMLATLLFS